MTDLLLKTGAMTGPYRKTKPVARWTFSRLRELAHDLKYVLRETKAAWRFTRHMRNGGSPDNFPF